MARAKAEAPNDQHKEDGDEGPGEEAMPDMLDVVPARMERKALELLTDSSWVMYWRSARSG
jgi:hypothetical protein